MTTKVEVVDDFWNHEPGWQLVPELSRDGYAVFEKTEGSVTYHRRVYGATEALMLRAKANRDQNEGRRFPLDGGFVIGSLPPNLMWGTGYMDAKQNEDVKRVKRFWNDDERFQPFRFWRKTI